MSYIKTLIIAAILINIMAAGCGVDKPAGGWPSYTVAVVNHGFTDHYFPVAINNKGDVLFNVADPDTVNSSYLWSKGKVTALGGLGYKYGQVLDPPMAVNDATTIARAMNDKGQIVGQSVTNKGYTHAFLWENGKMIDLGTLGGKTSRAMGINNKGQVVGGTEDTKGSYRPFIWDKVQGMRELGKGLDEGNAISINDKGQVIGQTIRGEFYLFHNGKITPTTDTRNYSPRAINNKGEIAGVADGVYVCKQGKWTKIKLDYFDDACRISGIKDNGLVTGCGTYEYSLTGFLYQNGTSIGIEKLTTKEPGWQFMGIIPLANDKGQILMLGFLNGKKHMAVLTPVK